jgi:hypothetical protein
MLTQLELAGIPGRSGPGSPPAVFARATHTAFPAEPGSVSSRIVTPRPSRIAVLRMMRSTSPGFHWPRTTSDTRKV